jgi:outer membrane protein assembly factor BamB
MWPRTSRGCRVSVAALITLILLSAVDQVWATPGDVLASFPAPGSGIRDLAWDGNSLWAVGDVTGKIYQLDPSTGAILFEVQVPATEPRGLAYNGKDFWLSDGATGELLLYQRETQSVAARVDAPLVETRSPVAIGGLAWDGQYLWSGCIAGWSSRISQVDPQTGQVLRFHFTKGVPDAVAANGRFLWNATHNGGIRRGIIYQYDYRDGTYLMHFDTPGNRPIGLVFDGESLWCADQETQKIYRLAID